MIAVSIPARRIAHKHTDVREFYSALKVLWRSNLALLRCPFPTGYPAMWWRIEGPVSMTRLLQLVETGK